MTDVKRWVVLLALAALAVQTAEAHAAAPRWLASASSTMTASVSRSAPCGVTSASYRVSSRTRQPIPVRKASPAPGLPEYVYAFFSPRTRVTTSVAEEANDCASGEGEACGGGTFDRNVRPRFTARTIRGGRLSVDVGLDTPELFFIPKHGCSSLIEDHDGLLPRRFESRLVKRVPYGRFSRDRFRIRLSAKDYPVSVTASNGDRIRGTGSFSMTIGFRPYER